MDMHKKYDKIVADIKAAREAENWELLKKYQKQLERWQLKYGAYAPVR